MTEVRRSALCKALAAKTSADARLRHAAAGDGCRVALSGPDGVLATLEVVAEGVSVVARTTSPAPDAGATEIRDRLGVDLESGWNWDDVTAESADELAHLLLKHLRRRVEHARIEPELHEDARASPGSEVVE